MNQRRRSARRGVPSWQIRTGDGVKPCPRFSFLADDQRRPLEVEPGPRADTANRQPVFPFICANISATAADTAANKNPVFPFICANISTATADKSAAYQRQPPTPPRICQRQRRPTARSENRRRGLPSMKPPRRSLTDSLRGTATAPPVFGPP